MRSKHDFANIYRANYRDILQYLNARVKDVEQAEDLAGAVFYKAWRNRHSFKDGTSARAWLFTIARNTLIDHWRKRKDMSLSMADEHKLAATDPQPDVALAEQERLWALGDALDGLPGVMKSVVVLRFIERMSVREVASMLDISEGSVRTTQFRALVKLREYLQNE